MTATAFALAVKELFSSFGIAGYDIDLHAALCNGRKNLSMQERRMSVA